MQPVPDPLRATPGRRGWTSTGLRRPRVPEAWQLQGGAGAARSLKLGPLWPGSLSLLWPSSVPPHPLQAKEASNFPPFPQVPDGKSGSDF